MIAVIAVGVPRAFGQIDTGTITGTVTDESGGSLPGVTVTVTNQSTGQMRTTATNELGRYQVSALQPNRYTVKADLQGFATVVHADVPVNVGTAIDVNVTMKIAAVSETVTVTGEPPLVESSRTGLSSVITQAQLDSLPSRSRQFLDYTLLMPATTENVSTNAQGIQLNIGGARAKEASLLVDGFYNQDEGFAKIKQRYSEDSIQEFQVIDFGGAPEYGRAIGGIINAVTKSGSNTYAGSGYGYLRNENLNAEDFGSKALGLTTKPEFRRQQWGGTLGGPIVQDKSFFFLAYERYKEDTPYNDSVTPANAARIGLLPQDAGNIPQFTYNNFAMGKWDYSINADNRLQASFAMSRWTDFNESAVAYRTLSAEYGLAATDLSFFLKWTGISDGGKKLQEFKVSYFPRYYAVSGQPQGGPPLAPAGQINQGPESPTSPPHVTISSVATFGSAALSNAINTYPVQALYSSTKYIDRHTIKFGGDYMFANYDYTLYSPLTASYSFSSLPNYLAGRYAQYTQSFGNPANPRFHQYASGFLQDSWQQSSRLTINYGVRYDLEVFPKAPNGQRFGWDPWDIGPRFALSYDLTGKGSTFLKLSSGLYFDRLFDNETTFYTNLEGYQTLTSYTWTPTTPGAPVYPAVFAAAPANLPAGISNTNILPGSLRVPRSGQFVARFERALTPKVLLSASGIYTHTWAREYQLDTNLTWTGSAWVRPNPAYRQILQYQFDGKAEYAGGILELNARGDRVGFNGNVTVARANESTNNYGDLPNDQRLGIGADWGPQTDTPVVRGVTSGWFNLNARMQLSGSFRARSGIAVNPVATGIDLIGAGVLGSRTPTFGRNSFRAPENNQVDARFTWSIPMQGAKKLNLFVECFNLLNHENVLTVNNDYGPTAGSPLPVWLLPTGWAPPREMQLGMRFGF
jgi:hypothetical protein